MVEYSLKAEPPLLGVDLDHGGTRLRSLSDVALVSLAFPLGEEQKSADAIKKAYGVNLPSVGMSALTKKHNSRLLRLAVDQAFLLFEHAEANAASVVGELLDHTSYLTDQTDAWAFLELSGPLSRTALERVCPINLHPDAFPVGACARTVVEHLGTVIIRADEDAYLLMSASSSAGSFLHAIETSLINVA